MAGEPRNEYVPDYVSPPGETLAEVLETRNMTQTDLAERTGRTPKLMNEIIKGKATITPETAIQLERVLSISSSFWNNRQRQFDEFNARQQEEKILNENLDWANGLPYRDMAKRGWVPETKDKLNRLKNILDFFGVATPKAWVDVWKSLTVDYRKSNTLSADDYALAAWLQQGKLMAENIDCEPYDRQKFHNALSDIKGLTILPVETFVPKVIEMCRHAGVAVVFVPELPKTACGATRWLSPEKALLQLSLRYKTDDHLWFTFFHEAAHILYHQKRNVFLEESKYVSQQQQEDEANKFAADFFVPDSEYRSFVNDHPSGNFSKASIKSFAEKLNIAPGIIVGRLQHDRLIKYSYCNHLKRHLEWS